MHPLHVFYIMCSSHCIQFKTYFNFLLCPSLPLTLSACRVIATTFGHQPCADGHCTRAYRRSNSEKIVAGRMGHQRESSLEKGHQLSFRRRSLHSFRLASAVSIAVTLGLSTAASVYYSTVVPSGSPLPSLWAQHHLHPAASLYSFVLIAKLII